MKKFYIPALLAIIFILIGVWRISDYGINWDAPGRMLRGQTNVDLILNFKPSENLIASFSPMIRNGYEYAARFDFLEGENGDQVKLPERVLIKLEYEKVRKESEKRFSFYQDSFWKNRYWTTNERPGHPSFIDTLASLFNRIFFGVFGVLGDIESYQLVYILMSAVGVFIVSVFVYEISRSWLAGIVAGLSLALFPLFFAESHFNMKDPIQASFFAGTIWSFWRWIKKGGSGRWGGLGEFGVFIVFVALALVIKWNIIFLPFILIPWLFLIRETEEFKRWFRIGRLGVLGILGGLIFLILTEPFSWSNPLSYILNLFGFYFDIGTRPDVLQRGGFVLPGGFNISPLLLFLFQTPEIILILGGIGVVWVLRLRSGQVGERGGDLKVGYLLLLWLLIPILRISLPHIRFYNGLRQIMEVLPALAVLSGVGAGYLIKVFQDTSYKFSKRYLNSSFRIWLFEFVCILIIGYLLLLPIRQLHPNQNAYFNIFAGGLKGAAQKNLVDNKITYGNIYKQAADWLNKNAEKDANLALLDGPMYALSPLFLREDISLSPFHFSDFDQKGEYIFSIFTPAPLPTNFAARYPHVFLKPVHQILVDGFPMLTIFKNDPELGKFAIKEESITDFKVKPFLSKKENYIEIDLGRKVKVTRIVLDKIPDNCPRTYTQFIDEFIEFDGSADSTSSPQAGSPQVRYGLQERKKMGNDQIELLFPAEESQFIRIFPRNKLSCLVRGKINEIKFIP